MRARSSLARTRSKSRDSGRSSMKRTFWPGRRCLGMHAISAIDIALHDLAGKQLGLPAYKLMGGARRAKLRPYCTIYPGLAKGRSIDDLMAEIFRQFDMALAAGFAP